MAVSGLKYWDVLDSAYEPNCRSRKGGKSAWLSAVTDAHRLGTGLMRTEWLPVKPQQREDFCDGVNEYWEKAKWSSPYIPTTGETFMSIELEKEPNKPIEVNFYTDDDGYVLTATNPNTGEQFQQSATLSENPHDFFSVIGGMQLALSDWCYTQGVILYDRNGNRVAR